jgi:hypothetical protein
MLNSTSLEVAVGMALVYLLLSFFCTSINEAIAGAIGSRARNLEAGIRALLSEAKLTEGRDAVSLTEAIYNHGLVQSLYRSGPGLGVTPWYSSAQGLRRWWYLGVKLPSYIPSRVFAAALFDLLFPHAQETGDAAGADPAAAQEAYMLERLNHLPHGAATHALRALVKQAQGDLERTRIALSSWYDDSMDRVSGWYKHQTQVILFVLGLTVSVVVNVDSIAVGRALWNTPAVRAYTMAQAADYAHPGETFDQAKAEDHVKQLEDLTIPIGWDRFLHAAPNVHRSLLQSLLGWLLTSFAVMLGAPFWFDLLNRFMVVRSTVKPQEKSGVEQAKEPAR